MMKIVILFISCMCVHASQKRQQYITTTAGIPVAHTNPPNQGGGGGGGGYQPYPPFGQPPPLNPNSIHFVGAGYNLLKGNPDGEFWDKAGDDPGLLMTRKVLHVSQGNNPVELEIEHRDACQTSHEYNLIYNEKSYQQRLMEAISTSGSADASLRQYAFTLSEGYKSIKTQTNNLHYVFQDYTTLCNIGHARFKIHLARSDHLSVNREFAASVCQLPTTYNQSQYMNFIDEWGTHMITEVEIGKKMIMRYAARRNSYFSFLMNYTNPDVSKGGPLAGFPESLELDIGTFKYRSAYRTLVGTFHDQLGTGNTYMHDEVELVLATIESALNPDLWTYLPVFVSQRVCPQSIQSGLSVIRSNLVRALTEYPIYKGAQAPVDTPLAIPIVWPYGTYGLLKSKSGCPGQLTWSEGSRAQSTSVSFGNRQPHSDVTVGSGIVSVNFCMKERAFESEFSLFWPKGDYCIYKYSNCPFGFKNGSVYFSEAKGSSIGVLPDGMYRNDTTYGVCCRNDGHYLTEIYLPTSKPFYLFKNQHGCQHVQGMLVQEETITLSSDGAVNGAHPSIDLKTSSDQTTLHFCYYSKPPSSNGGVIG
ncbi:hypothetical protein FSP39_019066 [Pinctada imbricata]|uniref:MACPF domain-containing protein n=1 Tax=Pinctada imbricata TaxID=66713 RepID=A0AA89BZP4_PINIB|nr:hypothetical protein FSP39_019066 [Pinctada imbricata]